MITPEEDAEIERILSMTDEECRVAGIAEFGSEEAWRAEMTAVRDRMLAAIDRAMADLGMKRA